MVDGRHAVRGSVTEAWCAWNVAIRLRGPEQAAITGGRTGRAQHGDPVLRERHSAVAPSANDHDRLKRSKTPSDGFLRKSSLAGVRPNIERDPTLPREDHSVVRERILPIDTDVVDGWGRLMAREYKVDLFYPHHRLLWMKVNLKPSIDLNESAV